MYVFLRYASHMHHCCAQHFMKAICKLADLEQNMIFNVAQWFWHLSGLRPASWRVKLNRKCMLQIWFVWKPWIQKLIFVLLLRAPRDTKGRPEGSRSERKQPRNSRSGDSWGAQRLQRPAPQTHRHQEAQSASNRETQLVHNHSPWVGGCRASAYTFTFCCATTVVLL